MQLSDQLTRRVVYLILLLASIVVIAVLGGQSVVAQPPGCTPDDLLTIYRLLQDSEESVQLGNQRAAVDDLRAAQALLERCGLTREMIEATRFGTPTRTPTPTITIAPAALDLSAATVYRSPNGVFEMPLPPGWTNNSSPESNQFRFVLDSAPTVPVELRVFIVERDALADLLSIAAPVGTAEAALTAFRATVVADTLRPPVEVSEVTAVDIGNYQGNGFTFRLRGDGFSNDLVVAYDLRIADVPGTNYVIAVVVAAEASLWPRVMPVTDEMIRRMMFRVDKVPTPTVTATLHPLEMTATALQTQIIGLTPSPTP